MKTPYLHTDDYEKYVLDFMASDKFDPDNPRITYQGVDVEQHPSLEKGSIHLMDRSGKFESVPIEVK
jgi:hypothetical protein